MFEKSNSLNLVVELLYSASAVEITWQDCLNRITSILKVEKLKIQIVPSDNSHKGYLFPPNELSVINFDDLPLIDQPACAGCQRRVTALNEEFSIVVCLMVKPSSPAVSVLFDAIMDHLPRAILIWLQRQHEKQVIETLSERHRNGMAFLREDGHVFYANNKLLTLFTQRDGLYLQQGKLTFSESRAAKLYQEKLNAFCEAGCITPFYMAIKRPSGQRDYLLEVSCLEKSKTAAWTEQVVAMLVVKNLEHEEFNYSDVLIHAFDLTPAESKIAYELFLNKAEQDIAQGLGIALNTVKTHRKRIYSKLNISNRADLITLGNQTFS